MRWGVHSGAKMGGPGTVVGSLSEDVWTVD